MATREYMTVSQEISQALEKLAGIKLEEASVRQTLTKLLEERDSIELDLGIPQRRAARTSPNGMKPTRMSREESKAVREFWEKNAKTLGEYRESGPIPERIKAAYTNRKR